MGNILNEKGNYDNMFGAMLNQKNRMRGFFAFVLPEGFEPPTTVPKTVVISISPRERGCTLL